MPAEITYQPDPEDPGFFQVWIDEGGTGATLATGIGEESYARLFTAAPELLGALVNLTEWYADGSDDHGTEEQVIANCRAAIRKATGESNG